VEAEELSVRLISLSSCLAALIAPAAALAAPIVISEVPAYRWYHGCGPTAAAQVLGYWDLHGYDNLFAASGTDVYYTVNVQDQISSPEHNAKYDPTPDDANLPTPPKTSIADWFRTSVNQANGWSLLSDSDDAFRGYAAYRGYTFNSWYERVSTGAFTWTDLTAEIDAGRPMMFLVDSSGDGATDHFVPVLGYDDRGDTGLWYGYYNTSTLSENETVLWKQFRPMSSSYTWGVGYGIYCEPEPIPEPATLLLVALAIPVSWRKRPIAS
jgi:hypothetical protein